MKKQSSNYNIKFNDNKPRAEIRDDLDSRKNEEQDFKGDDVTHEEQDFKGDDVTHNTKPHHNKNKQKKNSNN
jgi:hypothetical protein